MGVSKNNGAPKSSILNHFNRVFHYKPSILGVKSPYYWKHPFVEKKTFLDAPNSMEQHRTAEIARAEMGDVIGEGPILSWSTEDGAGGDGGGRGCCHDDDDDDGGDDDDDDDEGEEREDFLKRTSFVTHD